MQPIDKSQIKRIHVAKSQLKLSDDHYKDILSGFTTQSGEPAASCKQLNYEQADILINKFKELGWQPKSNGKPLKYDELRNRNGKFAEPGQMRRIDAMWHTSPKVKDKSDSAMNNFIYRISGKSHISMILKNDVHKIIKAIENL